MDFWDRIYRSREYSSIKSDFGSFFAITTGELPFKFYASILSSGSFRDRPMNYPLIYFSSEMDSKGSRVALRRDAPRRGA